MEEYGKFLCKSEPVTCRPQLTPLSLSLLVLQDFVIAPSHQRRGYGKWFLERIIEIAKAEGMNIALTSGPGRCPPLSTPYT
jgi:GNAT superfamily N-acetyltransferase